MQESQHLLPQEIYSQYLTSINGIRFSQREIDCIACMLSGRTAKETARLLSITQKTVETHIYNVKKKLDSSSIIGFIEASNQHYILKRYYLALLEHKDFEQCLKNIAKTKVAEGVVCKIVSWQQKDSSPLLQEFEKHLEFAGLKVSHDVKKIEQSLASSLPASQCDPYVFYIVSIGLIEALRSVGNPDQEDERLPTHNALFLIFEKAIQDDIPLTIDPSNCINFGAPHSYYFSFFDLLRTILPSCELDSYINEFKRKYNSVNHFAYGENNHQASNAPRLSILHHIKHEFKCRRWPFLAVGSIVTIVSFGLFISHDKKANELELSQKQIVCIARSDLTLPSQSTLLDRPDLVVQIDEKIRKSKGKIQTIALVGFGGAGKTTLARQYAHQQKASVIWEINAETHNNLNDSFEKLAYALSQTEEEKKILRALQEIKSSLEKEDKIIQFVKERLKLHTNWFLVYNSVENFIDIQKYFPQDSATWGEGKVLLTTQNNNIRNNTYVNHIIPIGALNKNQKLSLFLRLMDKGNHPELKSMKEEKIQAFLDKLSPFPLDISIAAYYLKTMGISFENYLERLNEHQKGFENVQEILLKETGEYTKTRYSIITCSLENIINLNKDFKDLLIFIMMIDSQNIPRYFLDQYKDKITVDNFIYNLQKYSLVTGDSIPSLLSTFSLHPSTQSISLAYLLKELSIEKNKDSIHSIAATLEKYIAEANDKEDIWKKRFLINHGEAFLTHEYIGTLGREVGYANHLLGNYEQAKTILESSLIDIKKYYNERHVQRAKTLAYLGIVYRAQGEYKTAAQALEESLKIYKTQFSENDLEMGWILAHLGNVYRNLGRFENAKHILEQSVQTYKTHPFDNRPALIRALVYLGVTYKNLAYYEKAEKLLKESIGLYEKHYPEARVYFTWVNAYLGDIYRELGKYKAAKDTLEETLAIQKKYFPECQSDINWILFLLAKVYRELGEYDKSIFILEKALLTYEKTVGKEHTETGHALRALGLTYLLKGNIEKAETFLNNALAIFQKNQYTEDYLILEDLAELCLKKSQQKTVKGDSKKSQEFKTQAANHLNQALTIIKAYFPKNSPHVQRIQLKLDNLPL